MASKPDADARITRRQAENARSAIRVGGIITRLQQNLDGKIQLSPAQVKSAQVLLGKVLPDQQRIETEEVGPPPSLEEIREQLIEMILADPSLMVDAQNRAEKETADNVVELKA